MQWISASATDALLATAIARASDQLLAACHGQEPDLVLAFISAEHQSDFTTLPALLRRDFDSSLLMGCISAHVIAEQGALEGQPAVSLMGALLPDVQLHAAHLEQSQLPPLYAERSLWDHVLRMPGSVDPQCMLLLADPYTFITEPLLAALDRHYPAAIKLGGLVSGTEQPEQPCLMLNEHIYHSGALSLALSGNLQVDTLVAQGCRPIGEPMFANATHDNLILQLDGRIPRELLTELYQRLSRADRKLFTDALFMGVAMQSTSEHYQAGDFLIRTLLGLDPDSGALLINARVPAHSVVQLHLRDAETSSQELQQQLEQYQQQHPAPPAGVLLFTCVGRGIEFFGTPDHDSLAFKQLVGDIPTAGFFCNGEIGPVAGHTYLHGYTSVFAIFRSKT